MLTHSLQLISLSEQFFKERGKWLWRLNADAALCSVFAVKSSSGHLIIKTALSWLCFPCCKAGWRHCSLQFSVNLSIFTAVAYTTCCHCGKVDVSDAFYLSSKRFCTERCARSFSETLRLIADTDKGVAGYVQKTIALDKTKIKNNAVEMKKSAK